MIEELMISIHQATNKDTLFIILYSCLSLYLVESVQDKRYRYSILGLSIFGLQVLLNFLELEMIEHNNYGNYNDFNVNCDMYGLPL